MKLFGIDLGYGNSIKDKLYWLINGFMTRNGFILWGGSPPPSAPTQTTVTNTNIPEYAQPYVMNMLNAAQSQIYNPSGTGFNPYVPYSTDPRNYVAGFSPLQKQAQSAAAGLTVPGQYGIATGQTLGATGAMGALAPMLGSAGARYAAEATSPYAMSAYMNPYVSSSLAPQLALAKQQYDIAGQREGSAAAQAGAFGGSRQALANALNQQNAMLAQNQLISQGYNTAFQNAQQAQQFGANLGLQGQQAQLAALQGQLGGANQLGALGGAQLAAQQGILGTQAQQGALEQQNQQNIINQAVQNYATAQQYPFMQLGLLNSMLRGLPMQQSSTQMYQAPPSTISQLAGLGTAGIGLAGMANAAGIGKKAGGVIKAAAGIPMDHYTNLQLESVKRSPASSLPAKIEAQDVEDLRNYYHNNPETARVFNQPLPVQNAQQLAMAPRVGLGSIATPPAMTQMAGGGIVAFADGDLVEDDASRFRLASQKDHPEDDGSLRIFGQKVNPEFRLFGHAMNQAARDADIAAEAKEKMITGTGLDWKSKLEKEVAPKTDSFSEFMKTQPDNRPSYNAPIVTPATIEANLRSQKPVASKPVPPTQAAVKEEAVAPKSDYDEIKQMLMEEFRHPSTKTADEIKEQLSAVQKRMADRDARSKYEAIARAGFGIMAGTSPHAVVNIGTGVTPGFESYEKSQAASAEDQNLIDRYTIAGKQADEARHQQVGLNLLKVQELEQASKNALDAKILALKQADQHFQEQQLTRNLLASSLIGSRNFKEESAKADKVTQIGGVISTFDNAIRQIDKVQNHPGRYNGLDLAGAAASHIPNTDAYDYKAALQGLKDTQFMASVAGIKGTGIGRILLPEVSKIQNSMGVLDTHQSKAQFDQNLNNLKAMILAAKQRALKSAGQYGINKEDLGE